MGHYAEVYQAEPSQDADICLAQVPCFVSFERNEGSMKPVTADEIKKAVDNLGAMKAPGPDDMNGLFYQKHWEVVKEDICNAVINFFQHGLLPPEINETIVTLIPKVPSPETVAQL